MKRRHNEGIHVAIIREARLPLSSERRPYSPCAPVDIDRREFARHLGCGALGLGLLGPRVALGSAIAGRALRKAYLADLDGDGEIGPADERAIRRALGTRRGSGLMPVRGYDPRADLFARMRVDQRDMDALGELRQRDEPAGRRPVTVAWHYGWYHRRSRPSATVEYLGGKYVSSDPDTESDFNALRNEFGITVDALSWISQRHDERVARDFRRGYLRAKKLSSRHVSLLYESVINLGAGDDGRVSFLHIDKRRALVDDFAEMADFLAHARDHAQARIFRIDGRPVIFVYGSHTWGTVDWMVSELQAISDTIGGAVETFARRYGRRPYLVGEELLLSRHDKFGDDRQARSRNFDALFVYHHASAPEHLDGSHLGANYAHRPLELFDRSLERAAEIRNRFTDQPLRLIPSLAAGFAKKGSPRLWASRDGFKSFLEFMDAELSSRYFERTQDGKTGERLLPVYTVGSWNEEFEGHALFPAEVNRSLKRLRYGGFDMPLALKQVFGWNSYARRDLVLPR